MNLVRGENNPVRSPLNDQCYFYSKYNKNASKRCNYYRILKQFLYILH